MPAFDADALLLTALRVTAGSIGTGFLVAREVAENEARVFLVTNKHVIDDNPATRQYVTEIQVTVSHRDDAGNLTSSDWTLKDLAQREHPDADLDVMAFDITGFFIAHFQDHKRCARFITYDLFATDGLRAAQRITEGDDILAIGFPLGLRQAHGALPLMRTGMIATDPGGELIDIVDTPDGATRERTRRAFLIDGAVVPGSSGSPVFLKPITGRAVGNAYIMGAPPPVFLGLVTQGAHVPIDIATIDKGAHKLDWWAGLGVVVRAEAVRETVELFFD